MKYKISPQELQEKLKNATGVAQEQTKCNALLRRCTKCGLKFKKGETACEECGTKRERCTKLSVPGSKRCKLHGGKGGKSGRHFRGTGQN